MLTSHTSSLFDFVQAIPFSFAALFPVLNPLGSAIIFLTVAAGASQQQLNRTAMKVGINTFVLLTAILLTGSWILRFFGITIPIVEVGGGLVVAYIGWTLLHQSGREINSTMSVDSSKEPTTKNLDEMAFFPITMPITAGPGCMAVTLTIGAHEMRRTWNDTMFSQVGAIIGILLAAITVFICYRYASRILRFLGNSGAQVIMKLSAFINLCIGLEIIWRGIQTLFA